jgi:cytochrome P450
MTQTAWRRLTAEPETLGLPGPTPLDMAKVLRTVRADPLSYLSRVRGQYGELVPFPVPGVPVLLVNEPDDARHVLQGNARNWTKRTVQYSALARVTGPGLLASAEPDWITHRRIAAPAFHHQRLERIGEQVHAAADDAVSALATTRGQVVDVAPAVLQVALDAVGRALFAADLSGRARRMLHASDDAASLVVRLGRALLPVPQAVPTPLNLRLASARRRLTRATAELLAERRAAATGGDDLLGLLVDSGLDDEAIRDELVTMVIAGHETVAASLTWTLMLLAEHPEAQARVHTELDGLTEPVSMLRHRTQLPWLAAVVDEALRLFPPAWVISRRSAGPDVISGHDVPEGTTVIISPWLLHRREDLWPDPLAFRPERFLDERAARSTYLPFGLGPRLCIGREFALGEMAIVLARLLSAYGLRTPAGWRRPKPQAQVAVHPRGGLRLALTPRACA